VPARRPARVDSAANAAKRARARPLDIDARLPAIIGGRVRVTTCACMRKGVVVDVGVAIAARGSRGLRRAIGDDTFDVNAGRAVTRCGC
jgi:hypothetical protein